MSLKMRENKIIEEGLQLMLTGFVDGRDKRMAKIVRLDRKSALEALKREMGSASGATLDGGYVSYSKGMGLYIEDKNHKELKRFTLTKLLDEAKRIYETV